MAMRKGEDVQVYAVPSQEILDVRAHEVAIPQYPSKYRMRVESTGDECVGRAMRRAVADQQGDVDVHGDPWVFVDSAAMIDECGEWMTPGDGTIWHASRGGDDERVTVRPVSIATARRMIRER